MIVLFKSIFHIDCCKWEAGSGWILVNPGESHPEQRGHGSPRESRGERCEDRRGFPAGGNPCLSQGLTCVHP